MLQVAALIAGLAVLDGRNRLDAMEAVGLEAVYQEPKGGGILQLISKQSCHYFFGDRQGGDPFAYVISANVHRRHLSADQKRDLVAMLLKTRPASSDRAIAKITKVSDKTVGTVRRELEGRAEIPHVDERTDTIDTKGAGNRPQEVQARVASTLKSGSGMIRSLQGNLSSSRTRHFGRSACSGFSQSLRRRRGDQAHCGKHPAPVASEYPCIMRNGELGHAPLLD